MQAGRWAPYLTSVQEVGAHYVRDGVPFHMCPRPVQNYALACESTSCEPTEPSRTALVACLRALHLYVEMTFIAIAGEYLREREATIDAQRAVWEASTPVLPVMSGLLIVPIVGVMDTQRVSQLTDEAAERDSRETREGRRDGRHRGAGGRHVCGRSPGAGGGGGAADGREQPW